MLELLGIVKVSVPSWYPQIESLRGCSVLASKSLLNLASSRPFFLRLEYSKGPSSYPVFDFFFPTPSSPRVPPFPRREGEMIRFVRGPASGNPGRGFLPLLFFFWLLSTYVGFPPRVTEPRERAVIFSPNPLNHLAVSSARTLDKGRDNNIPIKVGPCTLYPTSSRRAFSSSEKENT